MLQTGKGKTEEIGKDTGKNKNAKMHKWVERKVILIESINSSNKTDTHQQNPAEHFLGYEI